MNEFSINAIAQVCKNSSGSKDTHLRKFWFCYDLFNPDKNMANPLRRKRASRSLAIGFAVILGMMTGVLWTYANPIQLVPGIIQWRVFAFLPPVIGILISPTSGFVSGYVGTVTWSVLAGTFIPVHTLVIDGVMVGATGFIPAMITGRQFTLAQMAIAPQVMIHAMITAGGATIIMIIGVSTSFAVMKIYPLGWAVLWIGLSNFVPVVIGTPIAVRYGARVMQSNPWLPTERT
jgi:hypothetical protein